MNRGFEYLINERGLQMNTIKHFQLAYFNGDQIFAYEFPLPLISQVALKYKNSILFPVFDLYNTPIGFVTRALNHEPKSLIAGLAGKKNKLLYLLNFTYKCIYDKDYVVIVEGPIDALRLWQIGVRNVVALLGVNLSFFQICLLLRFTNNFLLMLDGDETGRRRMNELKIILKKYNVNYKQALLPQGQDPDSFINTRTKEDILQWLVF